MPPDSAAPATTPAVASEASRFLDRLQASLADGSFARLQLARPQGAEPTLQKLLARPVQLRGQPQLSLVWRHATQDITKNLPLQDALALLGTLLGKPFHHAHLLTRTHDIQLALDRKGRWTLRAGKLATAAPSAEADAGGTEAAAHDRSRQHPLTLAEPFLAALGIADAQQRLVPAMARKWRQINKFVEVLAHALAHSPLRDAPAVRVHDFGAGRGYLTFAVHHLLRQRGQVPEVVGVELREALTAECNAIATNLGLAGLRFDAGDVRSHATGAVDVMIALHACDTATDVALHRGIVSGAAVIVCSPCCHKQLRPQMTAPALLQPMLRHGIHMAEQAEMLTDTLRALLLQSAGYDTQVFEFVSPEHTAKNKMVLAVRRAQPLPPAQAAALRAQVTALKDFYGVREQYLESLLDADAAGRPAPREPLAHGLPAAYGAPAEPDPTDGATADASAAG